METFSALLAICEGNSPAIGEFPAQRPVTRSFDTFFDLLLNKRLSKQWWCWWFETPSCPLWRHRNGLQQVSSIIYANINVFHDLRHSYYHPPSTSPSVIIYANCIILHELHPCPYIYIYIYRRHVTEIALSTLTLMAIHYSDVIMSAMASQITSVSIVTQSFVQVQIKENMKALRYWPLWGEFTGDRWIPHTKGQ